MKTYQALCASAILLEPQIKLPVLRDSLMRRLLKIMKLGLVGAIQECQETDVHPEN